MFSRSHIASMYSLSTAPRPRSSSPHRRTASSREEAVAPKRIPANCKKLVIRNVVAIQDGVDNSLDLWITQKHVKYHNWGFWHGLFGALT